MKHLLSRGAFWAFVAGVFVGLLLRDLVWFTLLMFVAR